MRRIETCIHFPVWPSLLFLWKSLLLILISPFCLAFIMKLDIIYKDSFNTTFVTMDIPKNVKIPL